MLTSTNTGIDPYWMSGVTVVETTSYCYNYTFLSRRSPEVMEVNVAKQQVNSEDPEPVKEQYFIPNQSAKRFSDLWAQGPAVSQKSKDESTKVKQFFIVNAAHNLYDFYLVQRLFRVLLITSL